LPFPENQDWIGLFEAPVQQRPDRADSVQSATVSYDPALRGTLGKKRLVWRELRPIFEALGHSVGERREWFGRRSHTLPSERSSRMMFGSSADLLMAMVVMPSLLHELLWPPSPS
jgi:hypothetical protein